MARGLLNASPFWPSLALFVGLAAPTLPAQPAPSPALAEKFAGMFTQLPPPTLHYDGLSEAEAAERLARARHYEAFVREKISGQWFAALVAVTNTEAFTIKGRFETWNGLVEFLQQQNALVEVWAYPDGGLKDPRRISALEVARLKKETREQPTFITATYRDAASGELRRYRVEFGFTSAEIALAAHQA
ncbi:MAG TPA: hypothetical protein VGK40_07085, partial [Verrucomicrobiae bacterium]